MYISKWEGETFSINIVISHFLTFKKDTVQYSEVAQSCLTLCDPVDCSPPGSSVHGILQARVLEWVPFPSPGNLPNPGIEPGSPALQADALSSEPKLYCDHINSSTEAFSPWGRGLITNWYIIMQLKKLEVTKHKYCILIANFDLHWIHIYGGIEAKIPVIFQVSRVSSNKIFTRWAGLFFLRPY